MVPSIASLLELLTPTTSGIVMIVSAIPLACIVYWLRNERYRPAVRWFRYAMVCGIVWSLSFGVMSLVGPPFRLIATHFYVAAVGLSAVFTFMYSYEFAFKTAVPKRVYVLFVPSVVLFVVSWFNPSNLIYTVDNAYGATEILIPAGAGSIRPLVTVVFSVPLVVFGAGMVLGEFLRSSDRRRRIQSGIVLFLILFSATLGMSKVLDLVPTYFDPTPIGWTVAGILYAVSIKRYQFLQISPAAEQQIMDELGDPVYVLNPNGVVAGCNEPARRVLGIDVGTTAEAIECRTPALDGGDDVGNATVEIPVDGETRTFTRRRSELEYGYGAAGEVNIFRDVTELAAKRAELRARNDRLGEFADEVSHDLRSPLNVAVGHTQLAKADRDDTEHLDEIEHSLERMDDLIESTLERARSGRRPDRERLSLDAVVTDAWSTVRAPAATLEVESTRRLDADADQLLQLFENLLRNSVEHGSTGNRTQSGDSVEHGSTGSRPQADDSVEHGGDDVRIRVGSTDSGFFLADDGPGIPESRRQDVFERGVTYAEAGTGQGLSIVRNVVTAHGWSITVGESESGGVRFDVSGIESMA
ncbi:histidine kinase N-terminal 7TM domain-containing protein [Halohasta salina]|uniref:histidine kinase N-terminal 7TM domain-containing protein n=1 Tax=Halohasta salina TaxID=2961621 RepID=UPI0020A481D8|nr:histidine kinase N-terminal 7TM domain-containing protein [Halohasta salina]